jgi:hypothetical protein
MTAARNGRLEGRLIDASRAAGARRLRFADAATGFAQEFEEQFDWSCRMRPARLDTS